MKQPNEDSKAMAGEAEGAVYLRIPGSLKARIKAAAKAQRQSLNTWAIRSFELRLSRPSSDTPARAPSGRPRVVHGGMSAVRTLVANEDRLADRLLAIGRDCAARLGDDYRSLDHDARLYDEKGLPR